MTSRAPNATGHGSRHPRPHGSTGRDGFALPIAIFSLVVVGVLVTGAFYTARQETRIGVASENGLLSFYMAERAVSEALVDLEASYLNSMTMWGDTSYTVTDPDGSVDLTVTRTAQRTFLVDATSTVSRGGAVMGGATSRVGTIAKLFSVDFDPPAALTTQGDIKYGGSSEVHGLDAIPDGSSGGMADWTSICDPSSMTDKPGILTNDTTRIDWTGSRKKIEGNMSGNPKVAEDPSISASSLMTFGDMTWDEMEGMADKVYTTSTTPSPVVSGGACATGVKDNWGDPLDPSSPCFDYFPIILYDGGGLMHLSSGYGQGILLVDGDLKVNGGFEFYGPVFVRGTLSTNGSGGHFWGGVVAANAELEENTVLGNAVITYSSCSVQRAILGNSGLTRLRPIADRSWIDLNNVAN
jgi:hypothetical protein